MARLGDLIEQIRGVSYKPEDVYNKLEENCITLLRANNIKDGQLNFDDVIYVDKKKVRESQLLRAGDILICTSSGSKELVGKAAYIPEDLSMTFGAFCKVVRPQKIRADYLGHFFNSPNYRQKISDSSAGANINNIRNEHIDELKIPLPTIDRQKYVAIVLDKVSNLISLRKQQLAKLDEAVKARFVEMFGDPETNPNGWERVTVDDVCSSIVRGPFGSALKKEFFVKPDGATYKVYEQKHAIQKSATIGTYYVTEEKFNELRRFECHAGDILMSCSGTMGELYQLPPSCERGIINQALCKFTLNERILPVVFLTYIKETIRNLETKGSGIQNIAAVSYVKAMPINLPSMRIQQQFSTFIEQTDKSKLIIHQSLDKQETLKKSLMQQYFGQDK